MASRAKLVSVIMTAYNSQDTIAEAVESILQQTYSNLELLIADDGSTDNTREIIHQYGHQDSRIRCFHNTNNLGLLHTWNYLLTEAKGDLIAWQDADDMSYPERLEMMVRAFEFDPELMLCGSNYVRILRPWNIRMVSNFPTDYDRILEIIHTKNKLLFLGGSRMMRREVLEEFPGFRVFFDRVGWEDKDYILRVSEKYKVINLPDILYEYRYSRNSASRNLTGDLYLKAFGEEIGFFLARQRWRDGIDGLMPGGDKAEFEHFLSTLKSMVEQDGSIPYRRACKNKIANKDYAAALQDAFQAINKNKANLNNYLLIWKIASSFVRTVYKVLLQKFQAS